MDNINSLDEQECVNVLNDLMQHSDYDAESFRENFATMAKNDDGKISLEELVEAVLNVAYA